MITVLATRRGNAFIEFDGLQLALPTSPGDLPAWRLRQFEQPPGLLAASRLRRAGLADEALRLAGGAGAGAGAGADLETAIRQALSRSRADVSIFVTRPISALPLVIAIVTIVMPAGAALLRPPKVA